MRRLIVGIFLIGGLIARGESAALDKPLYAEVFVRGNTPRPVKVSGNLLEYDDANFTLKIGKDSKTLSWTEVTPTSAFTLRQRLIDKNSATGWLELGRFGWKLGAKDQAQIALRTAVKMDASLKKQSDEILAAPAGSEENNAKSDQSTETPIGEAKPGADDEDLIKKAGDAATPITQPGRKKGEKVERVKFTPATPEQSDDAMKRVREQREKISTELKVVFTEFETDHFIVFTNWDEREHAFLKKNLEEAYRVVSKQFDMTPKENIFVGKLPVYMIDRFSDFSKFASRIDRFSVTSSIAGYYHGDDDGFGHMAMWKPNESLTGTNNIRDAERLWAYVLVHEFTHAFLARYRSNESIPRWLNEGVAEVIASGQFPYPQRHQIARAMALQGNDLSMLFDDEYMPGGMYYPVMQTMVELLVKTDRKKFIQMIDAIKDGTDPEKAMQKYYNADYDGFVSTWRDWMKKH